MFLIRHIPHAKNIPASVERYDPVHISLFKVILSVPLYIAGQYNMTELDLISTQILTIEGLDTLQKPISTYTKKYLGVETIGVRPSFDSTIASFSITFNLNLRKVSDNYVFKLFKEWVDFIYSLGMGLQTLKYQYIAEYLNVYQANRDGTIWREVKFKNVMPVSIQGLNSLDYSSNDAATITVNFMAEYWEETLA